MRWVFCTDMLTFVLTPVSIRTLLLNFYFIFTYANSLWRSRGPLGAHLMADPPGHEGHAFFFWRIIRNRVILMFLLVCHRNERPTQPLFVLLREHFAADLLCYLGVSRRPRQVRTLRSWLIKQYMSVRVLHLSPVLDVDHFSQYLSPFFFYSWLKVIVFIMQIELIMPIRRVIVGGFLYSIF